MFFTNIRSSDLTQKLICENCRHLMFTLTTQVVKKGVACIPDPRTGAHQDLKGKRNVERVNYELLNTFGGDYICPQSVLVVVLSVV